MEVSRALYRRYQEADHRRRCYLLVVEVLLSSSVLLPGKSQQHNAQIEIAPKQEELKLCNTEAEDGPVEQADSTNSQPQLGVAEAYNPAEMALLSKVSPE